MRLVDATIHGSRRFDDCTGAVGRCQSRPPPRRHNRDGMKEAEDD